MKKSAQLPGNAQGIHTSPLNAYREVVCGSERSKHTYSKRLRMVERLAFSFRGKDVLDIGCGYGFRTLGISTRGAKRVVGIDADPDRVRLASEHSKAIGIDNVEFHCMNAEHLEFENNSFDVVTGDEMIHHIDNVSVVISEMYRVTKTGGSAVISDHNKWSLPSELLRYIYFKKRAKVFSAREIQNVLRDAGFNNIHYEHILFILPGKSLPRWVLGIYIAFEALVERTPLLRLQCGVYVIRGIK